MEHFVPKDKLSKKTAKALARQKRATWSISPVTRKVDSKKKYDRKKNSHVRFFDDGMGVLSAGTV